MPLLAATPGDCKRLNDIVQMTRRKIVQMNERQDYSQLARQLDRLRIPEEMRASPDSGVYDITLFKGVDLDGDGKTDELYRQCGDDGAPSCVTTVTLTGGGGYETSTGEGHLYRLNGKIYDVEVIVGHYGKRYKYNASIWTVTKSGSQQICKR